jgi:hypothetical protein
VTWSATEYAPRKRWWWFVALTLIAGWLSLLAIAFQDWFILAVIVSATGAFFVMYLPKPKVWRYQLTDQELHVGERIWPIGDFRAFTIETVAQRKGRDPYELVVLLPRSRFKPARDVYLTGDMAIDALVAGAFGAALPFDEAWDYRQHARLIDRLARRLGLS